MRGCSANPVASMFAINRFKATIPSGVNFKVSWQFTQMDQKLVISSDGTTTVMAPKRCRGKLGQNMDSELTNINGKTAKAD